MRMFQKELYKVYGRRAFILVILLFIGINLALLYTSMSNPVVLPESYRKAYAYIESLPPPERADYIRDSYKVIDWIENFMDSGVDPTMDKTEPQEDFARYYSLYESGNHLQFTQDVHREYVLFRELNAQLEQIENYPDYLRDIQDRAQNAGNISIFSHKDPFSVRNAEQTSRAFQPLEENVLQLTNTHAFVEATEFSATDFLLIALLFYVVVTLVIFEKEKGLFALVKPLALGRAHFLWAKTGVLFLSSILFTALFWGGNLLVAMQKYGAVNMGAYLQSVSGYVGSALNVTILQYWVLFLLSKIFIYFFIGLLFFHFALVSRSVVMLYVRSIFLFAVSFALYWVVDGNSSFQLLKYMNIINFVQVTPLYQYYFNLNIFSWPVNIVPVFLLSCSLFCVLFFFLNLYIFKSQDSVLTLKNRSFFQKKRPERCYTSLARHEAYKLFSIQKALLVLLLFACLQGYLFMQGTPYMDVNERHYKNYMQTLQGEVTDKTRTSIEHERERLASFTRMMEEANENLSQGKISLQEFTAIQKLVVESTKGQEAFARVLERFAYVEEQGRKTGETPWMVYETGYEKLTGNSDEGYNGDLKNAAMVLIVMIAAFSAFFATEFSSGMIHVISCCKLGRSATVRTKLRVAFPLFTLLFLIGYIPDFLTVYNQHTLPCANAGLASIPNLAGFPIAMKLWQYLAMLFVYRYSVFLCIWLFLFMLSAFLKNTGTTLSVLSVMLVLPAFLHTIGLHWMDYFSLNAFVSGNILLNNWQGFLSAILMLLPFALGGISCVKLFLVFDANKCRSN